jgi:hypothetical protein
MSDVSIPRLLCYMNIQALDDLAQQHDPMRSIRDAGYDGVQFIHPIAHSLKDEAIRLGLRVCGSGRVNTPAEAAPLAEEARAAGLECLTLHLGWGLEDDEEAAALISAVLEASVKYSIPLYPETHRATIFQDPWRTLQFLKRFPSLEFNGDFSHWYTGSEMIYGGFENKLASIRPVLQRIGFMHGRIGNSCCMQVNVGDGAVEGQPYVDHFRAIWTEAFAGFIRRKLPADAICFVPELLGPAIYYARTFAGREESDRWQQSLVLVRIARDCFELAAQRCAESARAH